MGRCTPDLENLCEKSSFLGKKNDMSCNQKTLLLPILLFLPGFQNRKDVFSGEFFFPKVPEVFHCVLIKVAR